MLESTDFDEAGNDGSSYDFNKNRVLLEKMSFILDRNFLGV